MKALQLLSLLLITVAVFSCSNAPSKKERLAGHWQAVKAVEEGRLMEVKPEEIQFWFYPDDTYAFESTLNYREAGHFQIRSQYLITTDTLSPDAPAKAVEIIQLTSDSLTFRMMETNKERLLTLVKVEERIEGLED